MKIVLNVFFVMNSDIKPLPTNGKTRSRVAGAKKTGDETSSQGKDKEPTEFVAPERITQTYRIKGKPGFTLKKPDRQYENSKLLSLHELMKRYDKTRKPDTSSKPSTTTTKFWDLLKGIPDPSYLWSEAAYNPDRLGYI